MVQLSVYMATILESLIDPLHLQLYAMHLTPMGYGTCDSCQENTPSLMAPSRYHFLCLHWHTCKLASAGHAIEAKLILKTMLLSQVELLKSIETALLIF
eukprot:1156472-Pelagomonas_calceolata.AAC.6